MDELKHTVMQPHTQPARIVHGRLSYAPADADGFPRDSR